MSTTETLAGYRHLVRQDVAAELHAVLFPERYPPGTPYHDPDHPYWEGYDPDVDPAHLGPYEWDGDTFPLMERTLEGIMAEPVPDTGALAWWAPFGTAADPYQYSDGPHDTADAAEERADDRRAQGWFTGPLFLAGPGPVLTINRGPEGGPA